jgi:hypothetical protein
VRERYAAAATSIAAGAPAVDRTDEHAELRNGDDRG